MPSKTLNKKLIVHFLHWSLNNNLNRYGPLKEITFHVTIQNFFFFCIFFHSQWKYGSIYIFISKFFQGIGIKSGQKCSYFHCLQSTRRHRRPVPALHHHQSLVINLFYSWQKHVQGYKECTVWRQRTRCPVSFAPATWLHTLRTKKKSQRNPVKMKTEVWML